MGNKYNINWVTELYESGYDIKFLFFWGHNQKSKEHVDKSCLSQWYPSNFSVSGVTYKTAEHWMMANKAKLFDDRKAAEKIINCESPKNAKELGRSIIGYDEQTWDANKFRIVKEGNIHKFNQNPHLLEYLASTGDQIIVEASPVDSIWGIGLAQENTDAQIVHCWQGLNLLGFALMEVRDFFKEAGAFQAIDLEIHPPWIMYPDIDPSDMFWRMGAGEDYICRFVERYSLLNEKEQNIYKLVNPAPYDWFNFYD